MFVSFTNATEHIIPDLHSHFNVSEMSYKYHRRTRFENSAFEARLTGGRNSTILLISATIDVDSRLRKICTDNSPEFLALFHLLYYY